MSYKILNETEFLDYDNAKWLSLTIEYQGTIYNIETTIGVVCFRDPDRDPELDYLEDIHPDSGHPLSKFYWELLGILLPDED